MRGICFGFVLLLGLAIVTPAANAQICPAEGPQIAVYFDLEGTQRAMDSPGVGFVTNVYVFAEGFGAPAAGPLEYRIDYGPCLAWITDADTPGGTVGTSPDGITIDLGLVPVGRVFLHRAVVEWLCECGEVENVDGPVVLPHPVTGQLGTPTQSADGGRSQTCQSVAVDLRPGNCINPVNIKIWDLIAIGMGRGGTMTAAVLGSETVDPFFIDPSSIMVGDSPAMVETAELRDVAGPGCTKSDGRLDLRFKFRLADLAAGIPKPSVGDVIPVTISGCYIDGMSFSAVDHITIVGNSRWGALAFAQGGGFMGDPIPNPFNPVTRIPFSVQNTQHVRLAVYDVAGRLVEELVNEVKDAGDYQVEWDAGALPSGVYFYRLETGGDTLVKRATLLK